MKERIALLCRALRAGQPAVTALVTGCRGATPRSPGALLVLTAEAVTGTVGGGQAEHDILAPAQEMLGMRLAVMHNLYFYNELMRRIRVSLENDTFDDFYDEYAQKLDTRI